MDELRIGIVGLGNMGGTYCGQFSAGEYKRCRLTAICDSDAQKLEAANAGDAKRFSDAREMFESGLIDAVIIATPHYAHTTLGIMALEKGLHTLVDKPISVHKADCERLIAAHTDSSVVFAAMFNQRTDPRYIKLKELIDSGELGKINRINWIITDWFRTQQYYSSGGWRATWAGEGGGVLLNQCPHQLDLWQWLFGMPAKVRAFCGVGRYHEIEVEDDVTAYLEYADGSNGVFITTTGEAPGTNRLEIAAEKGRVIIEGDDLQWLRNEVPTSEWSKTCQGGFQKPAQWEITIPAKGRGPQHVGIIRNFIEAVLDGKPLIAPAEEGIHSVELANGMIHSADIGQTVNFPLDGATYEAALKKKIETSTFVKKVDESAGKAADMSSTY
ncbi:Gfo/Idh/MocA family oxidoreductase [Ruficoccus amylovorans]|uniref:Gfo/Idh/MocA family oxidoreductase n=1 Tax=Ruficoccus amylovorans TaxID=1804625 RepID=A0A842HFN3_9BACT|nr:Gfo/Idh/MocA family oxidoreductase [Ruficoccus amylovorans]MBC2595333.1 Gfo/Idh/MocA family oxidoreductase [Ruficoccus amylovorans]